jgi:hypothetical protein
LRTLNGPGVDDAIFFADYALRNDNYPAFSANCVSGSGLLTEAGSEQRMFQQFMVSAQRAIERWHGPQALASSELMRPRQDNGQGGLKKKRKGKLATRYFRQA